MGAKRRTRREQSQDNSQVIQLSATFSAQRFSNKKLQQEAGVQGFRGFRGFIPVVMVLLWGSPVEEIGAGRVVEHGEVAEIRAGIDEVVNEVAQVDDVVLVQPERVQVRQRGELRGEIKNWF